MKESKKIVLSILITFIVTLSICAAAVFWLMSKFSYPFEKLDKVMKIIDETYVGEYDINECEEAAISGVVSSLGDAYAVYYNEENAEEMMQMIDGYYVGIGIEVFANSEKGYIEVVSAFEDSPADRAGLKKGDLIKTVDGKAYGSSELADAVLYMKGTKLKNPLDVTMKMTLIRNDEEITVELKREKIDVYKVTHKIIDDICYIRYSGFTGESCAELANIINELDDSVNGIVIDVRDNPGGEFNSSIQLCDLFLNEGLIMYTLDKKEQRNEYFASEGSCDLPLAVLVNGSSASASEIFAGSMKAHKRAVIIGDKTYGKGVAQTVKYLNPLDKSEGAIKITSCKNYTPDDRWINEGIVPDILVENSEIDEDITKDTAFIEAVKCLNKDK